MLTRRSRERELLDLGAEYYTFAEYQDCMQKLFKINQLMGILNDTTRIIKQLPGPQSLIDVGCGDGRILLHLHKKFPNLTLFGTDISPQAISLAHAELQKWSDNSITSSNIEFKLQQLCKDLPKNSVDIVLATLHSCDLFKFLKINNKAASLRAAGEAIYNSKYSEYWIASPAARNDTFIKQLLYKDHTEI